ncbi:MAG TPA: GNAT family N-acetyltransferase [Kribbella sp.]|nr:GNAT family N-acetyltransferase [Kribbella sp.]
MDIVKVSPDDAAACKEAVALMEASIGADCSEAIVPTPRSFAATLKHGWDGEPTEAYLGRNADGATVGLLTADTPTYDNLDLAWFEVEVHPDHRGVGHGSELLDYGKEHAQHIGRPLHGLSQWDLPKADAFAKRHGFEQKAIEVNRRQEFSALDWTTVQKLYDEATRASAGYELVHVADALPDELLEGMVAVTASINDAPTDDLEIEDEVFTAERLRAYEVAQAAHDRTLYRVIARERATGALAGHSTIVVERERQNLGEQHDTAVDRAHRGHRLGALVKTAMLLWMREVEPALSQLDTWNAESNEHMIGINEQLGYRVIARSIAYQRRL